MPGQLSLIVVANTEIFPAIFELRHIDFPLWPAVH